MLKNPGLAEHSTFARPTDTHIHIETHLWQAASRSFPKIVEGDQMHSLPEKLQCATDCSKFRLAFFVALPSANITRERGRLLLCWQT